MGVDQPRHGRHESHDIHRAARAVEPRAPLIGSAARERVGIKEGVARGRDPRQEAVVERGSEVMFYTIQETKDQIKLIRKRRPIGESTYQSTGFQEFHTYSISIEKDSLASVYTAIFDRTDWGTAMEGGILYTTIINGSCKSNPF